LITVDILSLVAQILSHHMVFEVSYYLNVAGSRFFSIILIPFWLVALSEHASLALLNQRKLKKPRESTFHFDSFRIK
jgi:hypothetical protein